MVKRGGRVELSSAGRRKRILQEIFFNPAEFLNSTDTL
jgi:hypothetical protein